MIEWRIYYADGSTFSNLDGDPFHAPGTGVEIVRFWKSDGNPAMCHGSDFYCWADGQWWNRDNFGLWQYLTGPGPKKVIFGQVIDTDLYQKIKDAAANDPDFRRKG